VAGPFYRFEKSIDSMIAKDISFKIHLRKKDEGKNIARRLNSFNQMLSEQLAAMESINEEIRKLASDNKNPEQDTFDLILEKSQKLDALINEFTFNRP
jgi:SMC interacting uncharacterized protein involved in chromosome segregation